MGKWTDEQLKAEIEFDGKSVAGYFVVSGTVYFTLHGVVYVSMGNDAHLAAMVAAPTRSGTTLRLRAEQQFQLQTAFNFQRTTMFAHANASETSPLSRNPPQNR